METRVSQTIVEQTATLPALDVCLQAEAKIHEARQRLLDARPGDIEGCRNELNQAAAVLERLVSEGAFPASFPAWAALLRIRRSAHALKLQIEYASKLYCGWIQLRLGTGYTRQGLPVLATGEPGRCSFEG